MCCAYLALLKEGMSKLLTPFFVRHRRISISAAGGLDKPYFSSSRHNTGISLYFFRKISPLADITLVGNVKKRGSDPPQAGPKIPVFLPSFIGP
jgi:hypothetical protein